MKITSSGAMFFRKTKCSSYLKTTNNRLFASSNSECDTFQLQKKCNKQNTVSFGATLTPEQEKNCKMIVNVASLLCAEVSASTGNATAFGIDAWTLRGVQLAMFGIMANYLDIPFAAVMEYAAVEYSQGAYLGCEGSKKAIAGADLLAKTLSGGTAAPISDTTARGINAGLSAAITQKMGRSFIKNVKNDSMTNFAQAQRFASYFTFKMIFNGFDNEHSIGNLKNQDTVKNALKNAPKEHLEFFAMLTEHIMKRDIPKSVLMFASQIGEIELYAKAKKLEINHKELAKQAIKNAIITSSMYEIFDLADSALISKAAVDTAIDISENVVNYPEVSQLLDKYADEFYTKLNLNKITSDAFIRQFKNRTFLVEFSSFATPRIRNFAKAWIRKDNNKINKAKAEHECQVKEENKKRKALEAQNKSMPDAPNQKEIQEILNKEKEIYDNLAKVNAFGYSKIAGYDKEKGFLKAYLSSLSDINTCNSDDLVNSILFFGPRGNGKTTFASAIADEFGMKQLGVPTTSNKEKAYKRLSKKLEESKKTWENEQRNSIILIDECTAFMTPAKSQEEQEYNNKIAQLINDAANKYHAILFFTTNYPDKLDKIFIDSEKIPIAIPLDPPNDKNALAVFQYYTNDNNIDYAKIMAEFKKACARYNAKYSNGQIKNMVDVAKNVNNGIIDTDILSQVIQETKPEITSEDLEYFEKSKKELTR